jgi:hypothetical protein
MAIAPYVAIVAASIPAAITGMMLFMSRALFCWLLADFEKNVRRGKWRDVVRHGERAESTRPLGMDHTLGNPLPIEVRHLLDQVKVLHQNRTARTRSERILIVADGYAGSRGQRFLWILRRHALSFLDITADSTVATLGPRRRDGNNVAGSAPVPLYRPAIGLDVTATMLADKVPIPRWGYHTLKVSSQYGVRCRLWWSLVSSAYTS